MSGTVVKCGNCRNEFVYPPNAPQGVCPMCRCVMDNPFPFGDPDAMVLLSPDGSQKRLETSIGTEVHIPGPKIPQMRLQALEKFENVLVSHKHLCCCFAALCCENNVYFLSTLEDRGDAVMVLEEQSDAFAKCCCGPVRGMGLDMTVGHLPGGRMIAHFERPCGLCAGCLCAPQKMVSYGDGKIMGHTEIPCYICSPDVQVYDSRGRQSYNISYPNLCCNNQRLDIRRGANREGQIIGYMQKQWGGTSTDCCVDTDSVSVTFPVKANTEHRVGLLGALMLIDLNYFEHKFNQQWR